MGFAAFTDSTDWRQWHLGGHCTVGSSAGTTTSAGRCVADLGAWLITPELAPLLGMAPGTVRAWSTGHRPRPAFELERCEDGASVWWKVARL
jgi:hypothetical protein